MRTDATESSSQSLLQRIKRLWPYFGRPYLTWSIAIGFTVLLSLTEPLIPALLQPLLDTGFQKGTLELWIVPVALISLFSVRGFSGFIAQLALAKIANRGLLALRKAMFEKLLDAKLGLFAKDSSSALANTLVYEVQTGATLLVHALMSLTRDSLTLIALVGYLLFLNWKLTLIVALLFPAVAIVMHVLSKRLYRLTKNSQAATDRLAYVVEENVLAHRDIRLHAAQPYQANRFYQLGDSLRSLSMKSVTASSAMTPLTQILASIALSAVISVALIQSSGQGTSVGSFVAFVTAMLMLVAPIKHLSEVASPITRGLAALERGLDLISQVPSESGGGFSKDSAEGNIEFHKICVTYPNASTRALDELTLSVQPGETIALVGSSGSGKTTLVNLLPRFIEISSGKVFLDGHDIREWKLSALRAQFAVVSQHVVMLNDTLANNVSLGKPLDEEKVKQCLDAANLHAFIADLPLGINTLVGHNAMQLSGGQRQRLAIARALYKNAPILILDEATSALDAESERAVQEALFRLMDKRTTLVIAHRLSTIQHANRIVVMDSGRIIESGTHNELLTINGLYANLYRIGFATDNPRSPSSEVPSF